MNKVYKNSISTGVKRVLTLMDRRPFSPTYGCFDREYWQYKTLLEFARADFQQVIWGLAILYSEDFEDNEYYHSDQLLHYIEAGIHFWITMRNNDGSVNEWFRNERSFCATAFTASAIGNATVRLRDSLSAKTVAAVTKALAESLAWLRKSPNYAVANQMAVATVAAYDFSILADNETGKEQFAFWLEQFLALQTDEGWFPEYEGADIGYSLLLLDQLAYLHSNQKNIVIEKAAERLLAFLSTFVFPDGSIGGNFGSRYTNHCFPFGIEYFASLGNAHAVRMHTGLTKYILSNKAPVPEGIDDLYFSYFYFNSYCMLAMLKQKEHNPAEQPEKTEEYQQFPIAALVIFENDDYKIVVNYKRGACKIAFRNGFVLNNNGYVIKYPDRTISTQYDDPTGEYNINGSGEGAVITITKRFHKLDQSLPLIKKVVAFKFVTNAILRFNTLAYAFTRFVKKKKVTGKMSTDIQLTRKITLNAKNIAIEDTINRTSLTNAKVYESHFGSGTHSPSSMVFDYTDASIECTHQFSEKEFLMNVRSFKIDAGSERQKKR